VVNSGEFVTLQLPDAGERGAERAPARQRLRPGHGSHRRGYIRVSTTASCCLPRGQYAVVLVEWQLPSIKALAATLDWLVHFLAPAGVLVIALDTRECPDRGKLRSMLARLGFRVEAGTHCEQGIAISARRLDVA
jgi:hypothetical protein